MLFWGFFMLLPSRRAQEVNVSAPEPYRQPSTHPGLKFWVILSGPRRSGTEIPVRDFSLRSATRWMWCVAIQVRVRQKRSRAYVFKTKFVGAAFVSDKGCCGCRAG